jgi:3-oxoacyl-[acyl-carrier protein] reductase
MELRNAVAVVTGASRGIGLEIARALVGEGARVAFAARSIDALREEVRRATTAGGEAIAVPMDVTCDASVAAAIDAVLAAFGRIDIVVNNAGNAGAMSRWADAAPDATRHLLDVHVLGAERVTRAALPTLLRQGSGIVVNFASTLAWVHMPGAAAYSAAKAAVVALSEMLREELRDQGIDVRVFAPPHTSTEGGNAMPLDLPKIFAPQWVAAEFVRALRGRRARVLPGGNGLLLLVKRVSPRLAARIMNGLGFRALAKLQQTASLQAPGSP